MSERHFLTSLLNATILVGSFGYPSKHRKNRELQTSDQHGEVMTHRDLQLSGTTRVRTENHLFMRQVL
jgi:hypothetical protein